VDFLDSNKIMRDYKGPNLPLTLLLAGNGTIDTPYQLNFIDDPLAKSLVYLDEQRLRSKLPPFF
jgi:hypothetical protein